MAASDYKYCDASRSVAFDIVIPSFRPRVELLESLAALRRPANVEVLFLIVVDRPDANLFELRQAATGIENMVILVNETRVGVSASRNRGIDAGSGDYVLFLDDDVEPHEDLLVEYADAIRGDGNNHPGYVGVVNFPVPCNGFTRGVYRSGVLTFFGLADQQRHMPWGVTANLCVRRQALGLTRFSTQFPWSGGGEDIDFCLRVRQSNESKEFLSVAGAQVEHPWWRGATRCYGRFVRWAYGDSRLPALHPQYRFSNWPTMWEIWLALLMTWVVVPNATGVVITGVMASVTSEFLVDFVKLRRRGVAVSFLDSAESVLIRLCIDLGHVLCNISRLRPRGFFEHFDFFCSGQHVPYVRRVAAIKTTIVVSAVVTSAWLRLFVWR